MAHSEVFHHSETLILPPMYENDNVKIWRDENDIIHTTYKADTQLTDSLSAEVLSYRESIHPGFATGHLLDMCGLASIDFSARQKSLQTYTPEKYMALAVVVDNPVSVMIAKMIGKLHPRKDLNGKLFFDGDREAAYNWLIEECEKFNR